MRCRDGGRVHVFIIHSNEEVVKEQALADNHGLGTVGSSGTGRLPGIAVTESSRESGVYQKREK